jgi:ribosomal protein L12E/L44/L45/RPP1/RPP2
MTWRARGTIALVVLGCVLASVGCLAVIAAGFALSFDAIKAVGEAAGVNPDISWLLPVSIDGAMLVATITAIVLRAVGRPVWYPWLVVIVGVAISIWCNSAHAGLAGGAIELEPDTARAVSAIPAVTLALSVHLLITLALAVVAQPAPPAPESDIAEDIAAESDTVQPVDVEQSETTEETAGGTPSGVVFTSDQARTFTLMIKTVYPDMTPAQIAPYVGRSPRQVARILAQAKEEVSVG